MSAKEFEFPLGCRPGCGKRSSASGSAGSPTSGYADVCAIREAAQRVETLDDGKPETLRQAEQTELEGRMTAAAFFYRSAEFSGLAWNPDQMESREKPQEMFCRHGFDLGRGEQAGVR